MRIPAKKLLLALIAVTLLLSGCARNVQNKPADNAAETGDGAAVPDNLSESDIIGTWQLSSVIMEGKKSSPTMAGFEMSYEFREDHTVLGIFADFFNERKQVEETWTLDTDQALICVSGSPFLKVRCEDGTLFLLMDEEVSVQATGAQVFTRMDNP